MLLSNEKDIVFILSEMKEIGIDKLPYSYAALEPFVDDKTMNIHYNKHYKTYVNKLNDALKDRDNPQENLEDIIKSINRYPKTVRNNAGGAFNHALFWKMLSPEKKQIPYELKKELIKNFKSINDFKKKFELYASKSFGSGWVWLVLTKRNRMKIMITPNQDNPLMNIIRRGGYPLLGLDLWEHAYYLKYQSKRDEYIKNFWDFVNWDFVMSLFEKQKN